MARQTDTREQILAAARSLFAEGGYAGTSMAALAGRLGISKAALYHHFAGKTEILDALLAEPTRAYEDLVARVAAGGVTDEELLAAVIDITAGFSALAGALGNDPSVRTAQRERTLDRSYEINTALTSALVAGSSVARAHAAYAAAKHGTLAAMGRGDGRLDPDVRDELLAAALRALHPDH